MDETHTEAPMREIIEVDAAVARGLEDETVRAFVTITGALLELPTDRARRRVLAYVADRLDENRDLEELTAGVVPHTDELELGGRRIENADVHDRLVGKGKE